MLPFSVILFTLFALVHARYATVNIIETAEPVTVWHTLPIKYVTVDQINYLAQTVFVNSTSVVTVPGGSTEYQPVSSKPNPVTQQSTYSTTSLSNTINPSTYTTAIKVNTTVNPTLINTSTAAVVSSASGASSSNTIASTSLTGTSQLSLASSADNTIVSSGALSTTGVSASTTTDVGSTSLQTTTASTTTSSSNAASTSTSSQTTELSPSATAQYSGDLFSDAISTDEPLSMFSREAIPLTVPDGYDTDQIMQTNKFYANMFFDDQNLQAYAQPYNVFYSNDESYYGLAISYTNATQRVFGPDASDDTVEYYYNPVGLMSLVLSAQEFTNSNIKNPKVDAMTPFSVNMTLSTDSDNYAKNLHIPVAIGMGFVTGIYDGYTPRLFSQIGFTKLVKEDSANSIDGTIKYSVYLFNGVQWNIYIQNADDDFELTASSSYEIVGNQGNSVGNPIIMQVSVIESNEAIIDSAVGCFPIGASLEGETDGSTSTYRIVYDVVGSSNSKTTLLYALPHHVQSFTSTSEANLISGLTVYSTNKGWLTGVLANELEMAEDVSNSPGWLPNYDGELSAAVLQLLATTVNSESVEDISSQVDTTSTYTAGKSFDKFAYILLVASEILDNEDVSVELMNSLKSALAPWLSNTQPTPFIYDTLCGGVTSSAANKAGGSSMDDYGAPFYNDHHFHYGYYVHTAAVIALVDKKYGDGTWAEENKDWVNSLVRDVANPSTEDTYFPVSRMFDYFHGHSWAHGVFASSDGKDEESTSEDYNFAYGMKLWGQIIGDDMMTARGDLMLAIMNRSMNKYFYFADGNVNEPSKILGNRVAGITFENKLDHTTYFGTNLEYIQGIHMIPMTPATAMIRNKAFVGQEWTSLLAPIIDTIESGWTGILRSNEALFDPVTAYNFFAADSFTSTYLDGGASRSWYLAFSALSGGA